MKGCQEMMTSHKEEPIINEEEAQILNQKTLPHDLISLNILTRLPIKTLMQFKCVSKQWYSTLSSYQFTNTHFKLSPYSHPNPPVQSLFIQSDKNFCLFDYDVYEQGDTEKCVVDLKIDLGESKDDYISLVGSCNGLLCLGAFNGKFFIIWNPTIHQWKKFQDPYVLTLGRCWSAWGFGYVSSVDDFKVVRVLEVAETLEIQVHVFSLRSNKWTRIHAEFLNHVISLRAIIMLPEYVANHGQSPISFVTNHGVLVNDVLYWKVTRPAFCGRYIVAFDLVKETFELTPHVGLVNDALVVVEALCSLGGILSIYRVTADGEVSVNLLKDGREEVIRICKDRKFMSSEEVVGCTRTGEFFVQLGDQEIGVVNPKSADDDMKYTTVVRLESRESKTHFGSYVQSAISPLTIAESPMA